MVDKKKNEQDILWRELVVKAQEGNKKSYTKLLGEIYPYVLAITNSKLSSSDAAEEVTQEVLISIHKSLHTYSPERAFKPWLNAIISYRTTDYLRKYYSNKSHTVEDLELVSAHQNFVTNSPHAGELKDIENALKSLPDKQREVFSLMKIDGYSAKEVSSKTGMSVPAVKVSVHRTLKKLKTMMDYDEQKLRKTH